MATEKTVAGITRHEYLLATDATYRERYANEVLLKMAQLVEALAIKSGLSFDEHGTIQGLTKAEQKKLLVPAVNVDEVREAYPEHPEATQPSEVVPPEATWGSEEVGEEPVSDGTLVHQLPEGDSDESEEPESSDEGSDEEDETPASAKAEEDDEDKE